MTARLLVWAGVMAALFTACSTPSDQPSPNTTRRQVASTTSTPSPVSTTSSVPTTTTPTTTTRAEPAFTAYQQPVDARRLGHSWLEGCPVAPEDLMLVGITHWGFDGRTHQGELVVSLQFAGEVIQVFESLFTAGYPIESVIPIGDLPPDAEEQAGYANTSGFNCRFVAGTTRWSEHARGQAIDINPHLNPLVDGGRVEPSGASRYVDRTLGEPGMIEDGDVVVTAFRVIGWQWGGHWSSLKDYHHFSATGR